MYGETIDKISAAAIVKADMIKKSLGRYTLSSALAGLYVGLAIILIFTIGGLLGDDPYKKILMGVSFGAALSMVIMAGSELYTGNNLIMTIGALDKRVTWMDLLKVFVVSYIGNLLGSFFVAGLFVNSGLSQGPVIEFIHKMTDVKMHTPFMALFVRGILCNILVCLAVLSAIKLKEETAKLIMIFWCLFIFITSGYEHSIANMTLMSISLFSQHPETITWAGFWHNMIPVTLGNTVGGAVVLGASYFYIGRSKREAQTLKSVEK